MAYELRELQGNIFPNKYKQPGSNQPDKRGDFLLNGVPVEIAIWDKEGPNGPFQGFKISVKQVRQEDAPQQSITQRAQATIKQRDSITSGPQGFSDDIPFAPEFR